MTSLRVLYDLRYAPITFDFAIFLALAECVRQVKGAGCLDVTIRADGWRNQTARDRDMSLAEKQWRLKSITAACCEVMPTVANVRVLKRPDPEAYDFPANHPTGYDPAYRPPYLARDVLRLYGMGADPRAYTAPAFAHEAIAHIPKPYVTLTLRQSRHFAARNVDLEDWWAFHNHLCDDNHTVVVIPDTEDVMGERTFSMFGWNALEAASMDLRLRLALYENAMMNVCSSNGPGALMFYSKAPVIQFDQTRGGVFTPEKWLAANGFPVGGQYPWSAPNQRMTWTDSTYENLVSQFAGAMKEAA